MSPLPCLCLQSFHGNAPYIIYHKKNKKTLQKENKDNFKSQNFKTCFIECRQVKGWLDYKTLSHFDPRLPEGEW